MYDITCIVLLISLHYIWHYIHSICVFKTSVSIIPKPTLCMTSHTLYVWHHSQYAWHHMKTLWCHSRIGMTSQRVYLRHHSNIYDISATAFMKTQRLYLTSHPLYLTSQPLYLCCNTCCIVAITTIMEVFPLGTLMPSHTLHDITITLYDTIPQYLRHRSHCIHDIRSPT